MEIIRKSLKAYVCAVILFLIFTIILAVIIRFTAYPERWSHVGLIVALSLSTLFLGFVEGRITKKRGLITGVISSVLFVLLIFGATYSAFTENIEINTIELFDIIPVITGTIGAVIGTNSNK